jgi:uncharacterized SAM-binding protein YcdF (DUF218 family)
MFKPLLTVFLLPPLAPLLLALFGLLLAFSKSLNKRRAGLLLLSLSLALLWLISCHGTAVWLARHALPQFAPLSTTALQGSHAQAIVVLGGGLLPQAPEYGEPQPRAQTAARLRYGVWLSRKSDLPLAFSGGVGWAAEGAQQMSEAAVATRVAKQDYGVTLRWAEAQSRDTSGSARLLAPLLAHDGVQRIALVTDAWHMPRALAAFESAGLAVTPAPMGFVLPVDRDWLQWMPSAYGLLASQQVLREWWALGIGRFLDV